MFKVISFVLIVGVAAIISTLAMENPGNAVITWLGYEVQTVVPVILATMFVFYFVFHLLVVIPLRMIKSIISAPSKISKKVKDKKEIKDKIKTAVDEADAKNHEILDEKIAAKDLESSILCSASFNFMANDIKELEKNKKILEEDNKESTYYKLICAMILKLEKKYDQCISLYKEVYETKDKRAYLYSARELVFLYKQLNDNNKALDVLNELYDSSIFLEWVIRNRFALLAQESLWAESIKTLDIGMEKGLSSSQRYQRLKATIYHKMSLEAEENGDMQKAKEFSIKATDTDSSLAPSSERCAKFYIDDGQDRKAAGVISKTWRARPIPALAEAYVKLWPEEDQFLQVQRIEQLSLSNKKHPVGRLVAADFNIRAKLWGPARKHLDVFMSRMPTTRKAARLMAEFEEGANKDHASANTWLRNVETAEPDARWICTKCGAQPGEWHATCPTCGRFATYEWLTPGYTLEEEMAKEAGELKDNDKS